MSDPIAPVLVRTYTGRSQADASTKFAADAEVLARDGYVPVAQSWAEGRPGVGRTIALGLFASQLRPDGTLTVTYERRVAATRTPADRLPGTADGATVAAGLKVCPDCAEEVRSAARICRFCRHVFDDVTDALAIEPPTTDMPHSPVVEIPIEPDSETTDQDLPATPHTGSGDHPGRPVLPLAVVFAIGAVVVLAVIVGSANSRPSVIADASATPTAQPRSNPSPAPTSRPTPRPSTRPTATPPTVLVDLTFSGAYRDRVQTSAFAYPACERTFPDNDSLFVVSLEGDSLGAARPWRLVIFNVTRFPALTLEFADNFDDFGALYTEATDDIVFRGGEVALDVSAYEEFGDRRVQVRGTVQCP